MIFKRSKRIYLDYAAGAPLDKRVFVAMKPYFSEEQGNPSAIYKEGIATKEAVSRARDALARVLNAHSDEIIFTGSGTEANNLAIFGIARAARKAGIAVPHIITSVIEHPSVLNACRALEATDEAEITYIGADEDGIVDLSEIKKALRPETILVSIIYANNEIGTIQLIREITKIVRSFRKGNETRYPYVHTDACQAMNYLDVSVERLGVDMLTWNGAKMYGPKGVGVLYKKRDVKIESLLFGGGQENGLRSGTENVPAIVGIAKALEIARANSEKELARLTEIRDYFIVRIKEKFPEAILNGSLKNRLPNNVNVSFPNIESQLMVVELDAKGIAASAKSACASEEGDASYVVASLGGPKWRAENTVRFSFGRGTTKKDINRVLAALLEITEKYSKL